MSWSYYTDNNSIPLTTSYQRIDFKLAVTDILIINDDSTLSLWWSWDGNNQHGKLKAGEKVVIDNVDVMNFYLKGSGSTQYRMIASR